MRLLIVRLSSLGDIVMSMAVLQYVHKYLPHARVEWIVDSRFAEILAHHKHLHAVHAIPLRDHKKNLLKAAYEVIKLKQKLGKFDLIIDMQGLIKSALVARLFGKNVVGFDRLSSKESLSSICYKTKVNIAYSSHILKRNFELLKEALGIEVSMEMLHHKEPYLFFQESSIDFSAYLSQTKKNILIVIGGSWDSKVYPKEMLKDVIDQLKHNALILWSNQEEYERAMWLAEHSADATMLPKISLNDLKALITQVDLVIGNDTGPNHMAWALNKPSVTILGCTSITRIPQGTCNVAVSSPTCVNPSKINRSDLSIQEISPYEIVDSARKLLAKMV